MLLFRDLLRQNVCTQSIYFSQMCILSQGAEVRNQSQKRQGKEARPLRLWKHTGTTMNKPM